MNLIRYCFAYGKSGKSYSEEKRLDRDELLVSGVDEGSAVFYFEHRNIFYKFENRFKHNKANVAQKIYLYESTDPLLPVAEIDNIFREKQPIATNLTGIKEKFNEVGIYSDIIDTLISPSNVRNFTDAINDEIVTIPDMIAKEVSTLYKGAEKILGSLEKLNAFIVIERENYQNAIDTMKAEFIAMSQMETGAA